MWTPRSQAPASIEATGNPSHRWRTSSPAGQRLGPPNRMTRTSARPAATAQPDSEARRRRRFLDSDGGLSLMCPALMADIGGTRYVTRGELPLPQRATPVRESVRVESVRVCGGKVPWVGAKSGRSAGCGPRLGRQRAVAFGSRGIGTGSGSVRGSVPPVPSVVCDTDTRGRL